MRRQRAGVVTLARTLARDLSRLLLAGASFALAALAGAWLVGGELPPPPRLDEHTFQFRHPEGVMREIAPDKALEVWSFGDFDLWAEVQLDPGAELDLVMRRVEPEQIEGHGLAPFHGRLSLARLSTRCEGPVLWTREDALFDRTHEPGGHLLAPRQPVTIEVSGRDRTLDVRIGGKRYPPFEAVDAHGFFGFVARGSSAWLRELEITAVPRPLRLLPASWAVLVASLAGFALAFCARGRRTAVLGALAVPALAWLGGATIAARMLPQTEPTTTGFVLIALCGLPLGGLAGLRPRAGWAWGLGVVAALGLLELGVRAEAPRLRPLEDPRLDALFGPDSGSAPFDAIAGRARAWSEVYAPHLDDVPVVLFLGGAPLWEDDREPERWTAVLATDAAARALGTPLRPVVVGTNWGNLRQQGLLAERYLLDAFLPELVVLGVGDWEGEAELTRRARAALDALAVGAAQPPRSGPSRLLDYVAARADAEGSVPTGTPPELEAAVARLARRCDEVGARLLLVVARGVAADVRAAVQRAAREHGAGFVDADLAAPELDDAIAAVAAAVQERIGG